MPLETAIKYQNIISLVDEIMELMFAAIKMVIKKMLMEEFRKFRPMIKVVIAVRTSLQVSLTRQVGRVRKRCVDKNDFNLDVVNW